MARPQKAGLDYFPLEVDFFDDEKVVCISGEFGTKGESVLIRLLCAVYRNGYFALWDEMLRYKIATRVQGVTPALVDQILQGAVKWGLFDKEMFERHQVLTSKGIQRRYFDAKRAKDIPASTPYLLLNNGRENGEKGVIATKTPVIAAKTPVNVAKTPQSKVKKRKEKEKDSERVLKENAAGGGGLSPSKEEVDDFFKTELPGCGSAGLFFDYYQSRGWCIDSSPVVDWKALARVWAAREANRGDRSETRRDPAASEVEAIRQADIRKARERQLEQQRQQSENPGGLSPAQIAAQAKARHGLDPSGSITDILNAGSDATD